MLHYFNEFGDGYLGQMLHYFNEFGDGYLGQMLHYFNEFGGYLGQMCTTGIVKSGHAVGQRVSLILQLVHCMIASY